MPVFASVSTRFTLTLGARASPNESEAGSATTVASLAAARLTAAAALRLDRRRTVALLVAHGARRADERPAHGARAPLGMRLPHERRRAGDLRGRDRRAAVGACSRRPSVELVMPTPGATRSGLTESSNARPVDENAAMEPVAGLFTVSAVPNVTVTAPPVSSVPAATAPCSPGTTTTGSFTRSFTPSAPSGTPPSP